MSNLVHTERINNNLTVLGQAIAANRARQFQFNIEQSIYAGRGY